MALTPKQELFAQSVASGMTQADAYRTAYNAAKMKPETVQNNAHQLMKNSEISTRVDAIRKPIVEKAGITLEAHLKRLDELSRMAAEAEQYSAAITAETHRGKASGLYVEKVEQTLQNPDGSKLEWSVKIIDSCPK